MIANRLLGEEQISGTFDGFRNTSLVLRREVGVFPREDLTCVGGVVFEFLWCGERDFTRIDRLWLGFF